MPRRQWGIADFTFASVNARKEITTLFSLLVRPQLDHCVQLGPPHFKTNKENGEDLEPGNDADKVWHTNCLRKN